MGQSIKTLVTHPLGDSQRKTERARQGLHYLVGEEGGFTKFVYIHNLADSVSTYQGRRKLGTGSALGTVLLHRPVTSTIDHPSLPCSVKHINHMLGPIPVTQAPQGF